MFVTNRFVIDEDAAEDFAARAQTALAALAARPGYLRGELLRAFDDPRHWSLLTEWESVGAYRRALGGFDVKMHATPLLAESLDEPSAFESLAAAGPGEAVTVRTSDRSTRPYR